MRDFAKAWLDGLERSRKDASNVARRLANKEALPLGAGVGGAPEAIALLERLGQIEPVDASRSSARSSARRRRARSRSRRSRSARGCSRAPAASRRARRRARCRSTSAS